MEPGVEFDISTRVESEINDLFELKTHRYAEKAVSNQQTTCRESVGCLVSITRATNSHLPQPF